MPGAPGRASLMNPCPGADGGGEGGHAGEHRPGGGQGPRPHPAPGSRAAPHGTSVAAQPSCLLWLQSLALAYGRVLLGVKPTIGIKQVAATDGLHLTGPAAAGTIQLTIP